MAFTQKENSGVLFKNTKKETTKHPDYTGNLNVEGTTYHLAAWLKKGKKGTFMSLAVSDYHQGKGYAEYEKEKEQDDIPF